MTLHSPDDKLPASNGVRYEHIAALPVYRCQPLTDDPQLVHAVFTRLGGVSRPPYASLNLGHAVGDAPDDVEANYERVCRALNIRRTQTVACHLTHSADVFVVKSTDGGRVMGYGDALITADSSVYLSMRFADCAPILLHDSRRRAVGLAHAGWRGTVKNVAGATVKAMVSQLGCSPGDITAVIGPAIGPCCYQVGRDVIEAVEASLEGGDSLFSRRNKDKAYFDMWQANRRQLLAAGVGRVVVMGLCTACHTDRFFSHRAEQGRTGRFGAVIGYR